MCHKSWLALGVLLVYAPAITVLAQDPCDGCVRDAQQGNAWCDDFEIDSGPSPECYDTQDCTVEVEIPIGCNSGGPYWGGWRPFWDDETAMGVVTCDQNNTPGGEQSFALDSNDDQLRVFSDYDAETWPFWILTEHVFVPCNMQGDAYWIVLSEYIIMDLIVAEGLSVNWSIQTRMTASEGIVIDEQGGNSNQLPLICDEWVELRAEINLRSDRVRLFYQDQFLSHYPYTAGGGPLEIKAIDLFNNAGTRFYYDDLSLCPAEAPVEGDSDGDGDVDLFDYEEFLICVTGPGPVTVPPGCFAFDFDLDSDVDWSDAGAFLLAYTGPISR